MSHKKLREDPTCLNCGHPVEERYCTHCGQENLQIQDSAFHLIIHYIQDMFHYDGRFWHTLKMLVVKPGMVPQEYMEGKRSRNLQPLRFYVFASTVFFLLLFYMVNVDKLNVSTDPKHNYKKRLYSLQQEKKYIEGSRDTTYVNILLNSLNSTVDSLNHLENDTTHRGMELNMGIPASSDTTDEGWFAKFIEKRAEERNAEMEKKHEGDASGILRDFLGELLHKLPQLLFLSMPFFALLLKMVYVRSKKRNYVEHFIFSIYYYAYLFVIMSIFLLLQTATQKSPNVILSGITSYISAGLSFYGFIYLFLAMKRFYNDRWRYLIPRYLFLMIMSFILMMSLALLIIFVIYLW